MRLRAIKDAKAKLQEFSSLIEFTPVNNRSQWKTIFENENPVHLEIGMGKGKFITEHALRYQDMNYIGCEMADSILLKAARNMSELGIKNLKLINTDAATLREVFSQGEIAKIYLNFSDPWPKARHEKRRLTSDDFINIYKEILIENGIIEMKTDNRRLFEYSVLQFNKHNFHFKRISLDLHNNENEEEIITTEYEDKFKNLGNIIYYIEVEKSDE